MESPISLILMHLAELHNDMTISKEHMENAWKRYHELTVEIHNLREELENACPED